MEGKWHFGGFWWFLVMKETRYSGNANLSILFDLRPTISTFMTIDNVIEIMNFFLKNVLGKTYGNTWRKWIWILRWEVKKFENENLWPSKVEPRSILIMTFLIQIIFQNKIFYQSLRRKFLLVKSKILPIRRFDGNCQIHPFSKEYLFVKMYANSFIFYAENGKKCQQLFGGKCKNRTVTEI